MNRYNWHNAWPAYVLTLLMGAWGLVGVLYPHHPVQATTNTPTFRQTVPDGVQDITLPCVPGTEHLFHGVVWPQPEQTRYHAQFIASVDSGVVADVSLGLPLGYEGGVRLQEGGESRYDLVVDVPGPVGGPVDPWVVLSFGSCTGNVTATAPPSHAWFGPLTAPYGSMTPTPAAGPTLGAHVRWLQVSAEAP